MRLNKETDKGTAVVVSTASNNAELNVTAKQAARKSGPAQSDRAKRAADKRLLAKLGEFYNQLCAPYVNVEEQARATVLAFISQEHVLFVGPPGDAKSSLAERAMALVGGTKFKIQLNPYTLPERILGPINPKKAMEEGIMERNTEGMIHMARYAYIDEIYRAEAVLDIFLEIFNERRAEGKPIALKTAICATNDIPDDNHYSAMYDRKAFKVFIPPLPAQYNEQLLKSSWDIEFNVTANSSKPVLSAAELDRVYEMMGSVDRSITTGPLLRIFSELEDRDHISSSNRRKHYAEKAVIANALLNGRTKTTMEDLLVLKYVLPHDEDEAKTVTDRLEGMVSPVNHITQLEKHLKNFQIMIADLEADVHSLSDINNIEEINTVRAHAKEMLKSYSNPELKEIASATVQSADNLISKMKAAAKAIVEEEKKVAVLEATVRIDNSGVY